jgi:hypothetical protein
MGAKMEILKKLLESLTKKTIEDGPLNPEVEDLYEIFSLPDKPEAWCVKMVKGKWMDIVYTYGKIDISNLLTPKIEYEILFMPVRLKGMVDITNEEQREFDILIGKIAMNIIYADAGNFIQKDNKLILNK